MSITFAASVLKDLLGPDGVAETELLFAEIAEEQNSQSRKLKTGRIVLTPKAFNGIIVASRLDGALRQAGLPPFDFYIDWEKDILTFSYRGDRGVWAVRNWTNNPLTQHESIDVIYNEVDEQSFRMVMTNLLTEIENIYTPRISADSLQSIPALG